MSDQIKSPSPEQLNPIDVLAENQFNISVESAEIIEAVKDNLTAARHANPAIQGIAFMGSRTKGQERPDSDIDLLIFHDSSIGDTTYDDLDRLTSSVGARAETPTGFEKALQYRVDISPTKLIAEIDELKQVAETSVENEEPSTAEAAQSATRLSNQDLRKLSSLASLFHLAEGEPVLRARKFVLDQLDQYTHGNEAVAIIGEVLNYTERILAREKHPETPIFNGFPKTVEEARAFFKNAEYETNDQDLPLISDKPSEAWLQLAQEKRDAQIKNWQDRLRAEDSYIYRVKRYLGGLLIRQ